MNFSKLYPHISWWFDNQGWIEIGTNENSDSLIRLLDEGETWWEDEEATTVDEALNPLLKEQIQKANALDEAIKLNLSKICYER